MRRFAAAAMIVLAACGTSEPTATLQPTGRSLLPPSDDPGSPSPSVSPSSDADAGRSGSGAGAGAADGPAPASRAASPSVAPATSPKPTKKPEEPAIAGQVLAGGDPVTDAQVTISGEGYHHNTTTSSQGRFRSATPPGTYTVNASSPSVSGCAPKTITVKPDAVSNVTITCSA